MEAVALGKDFRLGRGHVLHAVREVSFGLYRGAVVALVGESGSGKSTVARLLAGQERLTSGSIRLDGQPVDAVGPRRLPAAQEQGPAGLPGPVLLAEPGAHRALSPGAAGEAAPGHPVGGPRSRARSPPCSSRCGSRPAGSFLPKFPHELSGGQRQRVSFARALAARPSVLLADEPVSMLDVSIRLEMLSLLDDLRRRFQLALLYITHDIASARYFADEVLVMYAGQIVERGPAEELTQQPGASLHPAAGRLGPGPGQPRAARCAAAGTAAGRQRAEHRRGGDRLPVQPPVPAGRRPLPQRRPCAAARLAGPGGRLLAARCRRARRSRAAAGGWDMTS